MEVMEAPEALEDRAEPEVWLWALAQMEPPATEVQAAWAAQPGRQAMAEMVRREMLARLMAVRVAREAMPELPGWAAREAAARSGVRMERMGRRRSAEGMAAMVEQDFQQWRPAQLAAMAEPEVQVVL